MQIVQKIGDRCRFRLGWQRLGIMIEGFGQQFLVMLLTLFFAGSKSCKFPSNTRSVLRMLR